MSVLDRIRSGDLQLCEDMAGFGEELWCQREDETAEVLAKADLGEQMRWVPVSEGLPENNQEVDVFLTIEKRFFDLKYIKNHNAFSDGPCEFDISEVTHWRPAENDRPEVGKC